MKIKKFFQTPKKAIISLTVLLLAVSILGAISVFSVYAIAENKGIGKDTAISNAYAAAGVSSDKVDAVNAKFKFDDGKFVYEVEFYTEGKEYEYKIHSSSGNVVEFEHSFEKFNGNVITVEEAKKIALEHAGISAENATFTKAKLDKEDGALEYEIEFSTKNKKYEYEIIASNGTIKKAETKSASLFADAETNEIISLDEAKKIALENVGITDAVFTKAKLQKDDGNYKYDLKFVFDNKEYEYQLNAFTGEIIKAETEENKTPENLLDVENAKTVALNHANVENATFIKAELDKEDEIYVYEIEFYTETTVYEYEINAKDGSIINHKSKFKNGSSLPPKDDAMHQNPPSIPNDKNHSEIQNESGITLEKAKEIAFLDAKVNSVTILKEIFDDGKYEIIFSDENGHYEYEIDSRTGKILEKEHKHPIHNHPENDLPENKPQDNIGENNSAGENSEKPLPPQNHPRDIIKLEDAKKNALNKASLSEDQVVFTKAKLEKSKGKISYEIEFISGNTEYDFSIDAITGKIIEWESETI